MNNNLRHIIEYIADNKIEAAKEYIKVMMIEDKTQVNKTFYDSVKRRFQTNSLCLMELPHNVKGILKMEDVSISFNENRYFLSDREELVYKQTVAMYNASLKLSEMGIPYLNSLMLYGESGTGKTLFAKYIAYKLGLPFVYMNFSNLIDSYLGGTGNNISKAFNFIEKQKCVFMLDEVDAIGIKRGMHHEVGEMARIVISLMQSLDCIKNDTIVIGATNRIDIIDEALLRRFSIKHEIKRFTEEELSLLIQKFLDDVKVAYSKDKVKTYCKTIKFQHEAINGIIRKIVDSITTGNKFELE